MKAEAYSPGTYHVIVNPESFSSLPEYSDTTDNTSMSSSPGSGKDDTTNAGSRKRGRKHNRDSSSLTETGDPNVVILSKFEDSIPISSPGHWRTNMRQSPSRSSTSGSKSSAELVDEVPVQDPVESFDQSYIDTTEQYVEDTRLLSHFRRVVWNHLVQTASRCESPVYDVCNAPGSDIFEQEAATFRPVTSLSNKWLFFSTPLGSNTDSPPIVIPRHDGRFCSKLVPSGEGPKHCCSTTLSANSSFLTNQYA